VFLDNSRQEFFVYLRADEKLAAFMELESASKRVSQKLTKKSGYGLIDRFMRLS
jgi:hypothetical protein